MELLYPIVKYASIVSPLVGLVIFFTFGKNHLKHIKILALLLAISFTCDSISIILAKRGSSNLFVGNLYGFFELALISLMYITIFENRYRRTLKVVTLVCTIFIFNAILFQSMATIQSVNWALSCIAMMSISFAHLLSMNSKPVFEVGKFPAFWITAGIFFYCSLTLVIQSKSNYVATNFSIEDYRFLWIFHNAANIFKNLCFAAAMWWSAKRGIPSSIPESNRSRS